MKNYILTLMAVWTFALQGQAQTQECKTANAQDKVDRPILLAGGGDKGNGGFVFSRTSGKLLEAAQNTLLLEINELISKRSEFVYQSEKCRKPIDLKQMKIKIANVDSDYENRATPAINPEGKREERFFHINQCGNVEAARLYFEVFVAEYFKYQEAKTDIEKDLILNRVRNPIVHEALHEFGYNELESRNCSEDLISVLETYSPNKLKRLQESVLQKNNLAVKDFMISSGCMNEENLQDLKQGISAARSHLGSEADLLFTRPSLSCFAKKTTLKKVDPNMSTAEIIRKFGPAVYYAKSLDDVAAWLNSVFQFDFETPIPMAK